MGQRSNAGALRDGKAISKAGTFVKVASVPINAIVSLMSTRRQSRHHHYQPEGNTSPSFLVIGNCGFKEATGSPFPAAMPRSAWLRCVNGDGKVDLAIVIARQQAEGRGRKA